MQLAKFTRVKMHLAKFPRVTVTTLKGTGVRRHVLPSTLRNIGTKLSDS
jgi:hypothetical protein